MTRLELNLAAFLLRTPGPSAIGIGLTLLLVVLAGQLVSGSAGRTMPQTPYQAAEILSSGCLSVVPLRGGDPLTQAAWGDCLRRFPQLENEGSINELQRHSVLLMGDCARAYEADSEAPPSSTCAAVSEQVKRASDSTRAVYIRSADEVRTMENNTVRVRRVADDLGLALASVGVLLIVTGVFIIIRDRGTA